MPKGNKRQRRNLYYCKRKNRPNNDNVGKYICPTNKESNKDFFKSLFDTIALEAEDICVCGGDFNVLMDYDMDTTSLKRNKKIYHKTGQEYMGGDGLF